MTRDTLTTTRKWGLVSALWVLAALSFGAPPSLPADKGQNSDSGRVSEIWQFATNRLVQQEDVWFEEGDYPAAIQCLRVTGALHPDDYDLVTSLGWMLENVEEWDEAQKVYTDFRANNPKDPDAGLALADYYFRRKIYPPIPAILEPMIAGDRHPHPNNFRILAHAYEKIGKLQDAERVWKKYIALAPKDDTAKNNLRRVEKKLAAQR